jgi:hypothetical protein
MHPQFEVNTAKGCLSWPQENGENDNQKKLDFTFQGA